MLWSDREQMNVVTWMYCTKFYLVLCVAVDILASTDVQ